MNPVKMLRLRAGVTQQDFASKVKTSQSAIAAYEAGRKSPTLRTMTRFANSFGMDMVTSFAPKMSREDCRSLAFHEAIIELLDGKPSATLARAGANLEKLAKLHPYAQSLLRRWETWLKLPQEELSYKMLDPGQLSRDMRQVSPFSGMLSNRQRTSILKQFKKGFSV